MKKPQPCRTCKPEDSSRFQRRGFTRHKDRVCAACRRYGPPVDQKPVRTGRAA